MCVSASSGLRGVTAQVVIIEEAAFVSSDMVYKVIVPLLQVAGTALLAISTPDESDENYYSALMDVPDPDDPSRSLFKTIRLGLVCEACTAAGKSMECTHRAHLRPPWHTGPRQRKVRAIMQSNPELYQRETMGMLSNTVSYLFRSAEIQIFRNQPAFAWERNPDVLFLAVDPSGGGTQSDFALCTIGWHQGQAIIVGLDTCGSARAGDVDQMIFDHVAALRAHPRYRRALLVAFVEANMSWILVDRVAQLLCNAPILQPIEVPSFDASSRQRAGVITSEDTKRSYVALLQRLLSDRCLRYVGNPTMVGKEPEKLQRALEDQMRNFRRAVKLPTSPEFQNYTVKLSGKSGNSKDDLVMALMIALHWSSVMRQSRPFQDRAHGHGWVF